MTSFLTNNKILNTKDMTTKRLETMLKSIADEHYGIDVVNLFVTNEMPTHESSSTLYHFIAGVWTSACIVTNDDVLGEGLFTLDDWTEQEGGMPLNADEIVNFKWVCGEHHAVMLNGLPRLLI